MFKTRISASLRNIGFFAALLIYPVFLLLADLLRNPAIASASRASLARVMLKFLGIKLQLSGLIPRNLTTQQVHTVWVANHVGIWDIIAMLATGAPVRFITSVEKRTVPLFGWIAHRSGCVFVERRSSSRLLEDQKQMHAAMESGIVVLFPEATSTFGDEVLPFKPGLLAPMLGTDCSIQPIAIKYLDVGGKPLSKSSRHRLHLDGDISFIQHLLRGGEHAGNTIELNFLPTLRPDKVEDRKALAKKLHGEIQTKLRA